MGVCAVHNGPSSARAGTNSVVAACNYDKDLASRQQPQSDLFCRKRRDPRNETGRHYGFATRPLAFVI